MLIYNLQEVLINVRGGDNFMNRRSGLQYVKSEIINLIKMYNEGHFSIQDLIKNIIIRSPVRIMPSSIRKFLYKILRK